MPAGGLRRPRIDEVRLRWAHSVTVGDELLVLDGFAARSLVGLLAREGGARELRRVLAQGGEIGLERLDDEAVADALARRLERGQLRAVVSAHGFAVSLGGDAEEPSPPPAPPLPAPRSVIWEGDIVAREPARWAARILIQEPPRFTGRIRETPPGTTSGTS